MISDNFRIVYRILAELEAGMDLNEINQDSISYKTLGITKERWNKYIEMMDDVGYIKGVKIEKYITGTKIDAKEIQITLKGLEYLQENSIMRQMYKAAKGIVDIIP